MHFRFHFDREGFHKEFTKDFGSRFAGRSSRWAAFAQRFSDEFGPGSGGGNTRGPRRRRFGAEALKILVLHLLKAEPRHGYELIKAIEAMSAGLYSPSPGMIYPMLAMLADEGLITEVAGEESRRRYAITAAGHAALAAAEAEVKDVLSRLAELAGAVRDDETQPLRAAMRTLKDVTRARMAADDADADTAKWIAEILAEAAEKIGKL